LAYVQDRQRTVILHIGDLDLHGLRNIARPFEQDLHQIAVDVIRRGHAPDLIATFIHVRRLLVPPRARRTRSFYEV
jgi:hypothetical protein